MKTLIKNAKLIDGQLVNILIEDNKISKKTNNQGDNVDTIIDAKMCYAISGCVNYYFDGDLKDASKLLSQGITSVFDFSNDDSVTEYLVNSGIKVFKAIGDFDGNTLLDEEILSSEVKKTKNQGVVQPIIYIKNPNECEEDNFSSVINFASDNDYLVATHASETLNNVGEIDKQFSLSPIGLLENYGFLDRRHMLIDCVYADKDDVEILRNYDTLICSRPSNNLRDGYGIAPIYSFLKNKLNVVVGGLTNNYYNEIKLIGDLQSGVLNEKNIISMGDLENIAFNNRRLFDEIGGINDGLNADIVFVDDNDIINLTPKNVKMVIINGKIVYQN